jgi:hypothetical protein
MLTDATHRRSAGYAAAKWLGSGIYVCGECGGPMRSASIHTPKRKMSTYRCAEFSHVVIMATKTDEWVKDVIALEVRDPAVLAGITAGESDTMQVDRERRALLLTRLEQTEADYDEDLIDARRFKAKTEKLTVELTAIEQRLVDGVEQATISPIFSKRDPGKAFLAAPLDVQRAVFRAVLKVEVLKNPSDRRGKEWSSDRLRLTPLGRPVEAEATA